jgi:hypothetical protein
VNPPKKEKLVFISHSGEDTWIARQIAKGVTDHGATAFLDEADIKIASEFEDDIRNFLKIADELLVLLTPSALERPYVWAELGAAWLREIPIVVVLHGLTVKEFQAKSKIPVFLKGRNVISLNNIDQYLSQLDMAVGKKDQND